MLDNSVALDGYGPGGTFQLLIANTGHGLVAIYFPSSCGNTEELGTDPLMGPTSPVNLIKTITGVCS